MAEATRAASDAPLDERLAALFASEPQALADPEPLFRELREAAPLHRLESMVLVTRHAEAKAIFRDGSRFSSAFYRTGSWAKRNRARLAGRELSAFDDLAALDEMRMAATDGEVHDRLRRIAHRGFTPRRIAALERAAAAYVEELLDLLEQDANPDLIVFAYRLPLMIIVDLLGVPQADRELIHHWSDLIGRNRGGTEPEVLLEAHAAMLEFHAYVEAMLDEQRRSTARGDLVGALIDAEHEERLTPRELAVTFQMLLFAGHETTTNLIGGGLLALLRNPDQWRALCAGQVPVAGAVEELLRYVTPVQHSSRVALVDVEIAGCPVAAGTTVRLLTASANRDEAVFADGECLELGRANAREHLALGFGPHFCLGASLARLEGSLALAALVRRFPGLELASDELEWTGSSTLRRLKALPVSLGGGPRRRRGQTVDAGASAASSPSTRPASTTPST